MRISDWSSDVCSSDLAHGRDCGSAPARGFRPAHGGAALWAGRDGGAGRGGRGGGDRAARRGCRGDRHGGAAPAAGQAADRKSVVVGKSVSVRVDLGGLRIIQTTIYIFICSFYFFFLYP